MRPCGGGEWQKESTVQRRLRERLVITTLIFPTTADQYSVCSLSTALIRFFDFFLLRNVENMA